MRALATFAAIASWRQLYSPSRSAIPVRLFSPRVAARSSPTFSILAMVPPPQPTSFWHPSTTHVPTPAVPSPSPSDGPGSYPVPPPNPFELPSSQSFSPLVTTHISPPFPSPSRSSPSFALHISSPHTSLPSADGTCCTTILCPHPVLLLLLLDAPDEEPPFSIQRPNPPLTSRPNPRLLPSLPLLQAPSLSIPLPFSVFYLDPLDSSFCHPLSPFPIPLNCFSFQGPFAIQGPLSLSPYFFCNPSSPFLAGHAPFPLPRVPDPHPPPWNSPGPPA
ncbi:hypothetical protein AMTR_s00041p00195050, partial [Amborella trichopoda]